MCQDPLAVLLVLVEAMRVVVVVVVADPAVG
jgi:hypothetical protein